MSDILRKRRTWLSVVLCGLLILGLLLIPTGFEQAGAAWHDGGERIAAEVISVDNSLVINTGLVQAGEQRCQVKLLSGSHAGERYMAENMLT
jgi:hypothetical protein